VTESTRWTLRALQEAEDWIDWLGEHNTKAATQAVKELLLRTDRLARFNELGRIGSVPGTRELSMPKWKKVVVYIVSDGSVKIITLRDTRQKPLP
jgi:plasmid stabilization system protein ParE